MRIRHFYIMSGVLRLTVCLRSSKSDSTTPVLQRHRKGATFHKGGHDMATIVLPKTVRGGGGNGKNVADNGPGGLLSGGTDIGATDPM